MTSSENARMRELIGILNEASRVYYAEDREIMSNLEYDRLSDELTGLENRTGTVMADSPSLRVGYEAVDTLPKEDHASPMLSLDKTKERSQIAAFAGEHKTLLSWKMDGLTVVLTYENGVLFKGVTRGNGITGEVITPNVRAFRNVPLKIPFAGRLILRGEAVIRYRDFEEINAKLPEGEKPYKNPRNLCSGSVRQLDSSVTAARRVYLYAFALVSAEGVDFHDSHEEEFRFLSSLGFEVVEYEVIDESNAEAAIARFEEKIRTNEFPSDGLVALYDSISYGDSLGRTAKFPRNAIAFKWQDELAETTLREIEWSASRTGRINPVAIFDPVELEGTTVQRASVHNVSIVRSLRLGIGDRVTVYKANMIIPQIAENLTGSGNIAIPDTCPVCGQEAKIRTETGTDGAVETLYCENPECPAKKVLSYANFVSRDALNVDGLSEATLEKLIDTGIIRDLSDIFRLPEHKDKIVAMEGFGEKSYEKLISSAEKARRTTCARLLFGLGIAGVGTATAKLVASSFDGDIERIRNADEEEFSMIDTVGPVVAHALFTWFREKNHILLLDRLLEYVILEKEKKTEGGRLKGKTFVITGSLARFGNRSELVAVIEGEGGKCSSSVSAKTDYLINNNTASTSGKNKKAKELGIPVISEEEFLAMLNT